MAEHAQHHCGLSLGERDLHPTIGHSRRSDHELLDEQVPPLLLQVHRETCWRSMHMKFSSSVIFTCENSDRSETYAVTSPRPVHREQALHWGVIEFNTVRMITCHYPQQLLHSVTTDSLLLPVHVKESDA